MDDGGVTFASVYDGSRLRLTPESAVEAQGLIGADIQMVLDVCTALPATAEALRSAVERTATWAGRARRHHERLEARPEGQALFGIVQGGTDPGLRAESAERTVALGFDGYAIGGLSVGEPREAMLEALAATLPFLPTDRPRYLMGVGDPIGMMEAVALGIDQFDCVAPTRMGRHGTILTRQGKLNLRNAAHAQDDTPLDAECGCLTCSRWSRGYLRHLLGVGEPDGLAPADHPQPGLRAGSDVSGPGRHRRGPLRGVSGGHHRGVGFGQVAASVVGGPGLQSDRCVEP